MAFTKATFPVCDSNSCPNGKCEEGVCVQDDPCEFKHGHYGANCDPDWCTVKSNDGNFSLRSDCRVDITSVKSTCNISRQEVPLNDDDYPTCIGSGCSGNRRLNTKQSIT